MQNVEEVTDADRLRGMERNNPRGKKWTGSKADGDNVAEYSRIPSNQKSAIYCQVIFMCKAVSFGPKENGKFVHAVWTFGRFMIAAWPYSMKFTTHLIALMLFWSVWRSLGVAVFSTT